MLVIPLQAIPNQTLQVQLNGQACTITVYQNAYGLFVDVIKDRVQLIAGVIALNLTRLIRNQYRGFVGDLLFFDTQGDTAPVYTGLSSRYYLLYADADEVPEEVG